MTVGVDGRTDYVEGITGSLGSSYKVATQVGVPMFDTSGNKIVPFWNNPDYYLGHIRNLDIDGNYKRYQRYVRLLETIDPKPTIKPARLSTIFRHTGMNGLRRYFTTIGSKTK